MTTARETLRAAANVIIIALEAQPQAIATATTLRQFGDIAGEMLLSMADLVAGLEIAARAGDSDLPPVVARRGTCREIATLLGPGTAALAPLFTPAGDAKRLAAAWRAVAQYFAGTLDPRRAAITATLMREASEIEGVAS